jgi:hypothetical protein
MERMWVAEAKMKYPKQWLVAVNLVWEPNNKVIGDIFLVTPDEDEARSKLRELRKSGSMGKVMVLEGYNDAPQIGGLWVCNQ